MSTERNNVVSFDVSEEEEDNLIFLIATRAIKEIPELKNPDWGTLDVEMDLCATIAQGVPLRLEELLKTDKVNFQHDLIGITRNLNRETGKLENNFLPRFAR